MALPIETNLNIHFYLNLFLRAIKKNAILAIWGYFFFDFAPFLFSIDNKSAFRADPNVPIPGSYTSLVRKLREKTKIGKLSFLAKIRGPENGIFRHFLTLRLFCSRKWP